MNIDNVKVNASSANGLICGIRNRESAYIQNTSVEVNSTASGYALGISNFKTMEIKSVNVFADAGSSSAIQENGYGISTGIENGGEMKFYSGSVYGVHSGLQNNANAKLYVYGGTFDGYGHGGIYFAQGANGEAYVENAELKSGAYTGKHDESKFETVHGGCLYIGGGTAENNSNCKVYMNGCTLTTLGNVTIVLRGSSGEKNNELYISNSTMQAGKTARIDENQKLYVGKGTNITTSNVTSADRVEFTNEDYKR